MKKLICAGFLPFLLAFCCMSQTQESLCPKHIETPEYPPVARIARISGVVVMTLTIDAEGKVSDVKVTNEDQRFVKLLEIGAVKNIRLWTFAKPQSGPFTSTITYDFQIDDKLPLAGVEDHPTVTFVTYDLPGRVTIRTNAHVVESD